MQTIQPTQTDQVITQLVNKYKDSNIHQEKTNSTKSIFLSKNLTKHTLSKLSTFCSKYSHFLTKASNLFIKTLSVTNKSTHK